MAKASPWCARKRSRSQPTPKAQRRRRMIIPVSIDKAAQSVAQGGGGKDVENNANGVSVPEWSMVELQGELISKDPLTGQALGSMTSENGKPTLVISNHKLEGKAASEPKPLLVLRKVVVDVNDENSSSSNNRDSSGRSNGNGGGGGGGGGGGEAAGGEREGGSAGRAERRSQGQRVEYRIVGRVTRKTIFKTRPKPLIRKLGDGGGHGGGSTARSVM